MHTFKEFVSSPKNFIFNSHGSHHHKLTESLVEMRYNSSKELDLNKNFLQKDENKHLGKTIDDQMSKLHELHPATEEHANHFKKFTQNSKKLTEYLLDRHKQNIPAQEYYNGHHIKGLDSTFQPAKESFHTYSGAGFDIREVTPSGKSKSGKKTYELPTFMSSTHNKEVALRFSRKSKLDNKNYQLLHWVTNPGDPVAVVGKHSDYKSEMETLHPRTNSTDNKYHIEHLGTTTYVGNLGERYDVHHVRKIPESEIKLSRKK